MTLTEGSRLGPYEIVAPLGAGGMGEVYRARDTKLNRDVAIKVLPAAFAQDHERVTRFKREAQVLASLNHPNIAAIYGLEEVDPSASSGQAGIVALVMELVEGEDLSAHIARGAMPIAEVLPIARQIAEALEAAHEQGVVHRDLKPANIKVTPLGKVKVLDFGLAKAFQGDGTSSRAGAVPELVEGSHSPTMSRHMTEAGIILGTAAYMSPEQARGKSVDRRADVWSFGVVLFEMLTGTRLFVGETTSDVLARVLMADPDWSLLPATTPEPIRKLLRRCLARDPRNRLRDIGEARIGIEEYQSNPAASVTMSGASATAITGRPGSQAMPWAVAGVLGLALVTALLVWSPWRAAEAPAPRRLLTHIGADVSLPTDIGPSAVLSPDGTALAFVGEQAGNTRLYVRRLDQLQATPFENTEGARDPFFSPDGQWIGFVSRNALKKVSVTGGAALTVSVGPVGGILRGATWTEDGTIVFQSSTDVSDLGPLIQVPAVGGTPVAFAALSTGAVVQRWPQALPGGAGVIASEKSIVNWEAANIVVLPRGGGAPKVVVRGGYFGRYLPNGYLVYMQGGTLFGVGFDLGRLETVGTAVPVLEGVAVNPWGSAQISFSSDGTLAYVPSDTVSPERTMDWMTRDGKASVLRDAKVQWGNPRFSPDGEKLALDVYDGKQSEIWVYEWARDTMTQITFDPGNDAVPVWTPDGRRIVFTSDRAKTGIYNLYWVNADGSGDVTRLADSSELQFPLSWHPSGRFLAFHQGQFLHDVWDLMILPIDGDAKRGPSPGKPTVFLGTPAVEAYPEFSPDGRWIAYVSREGVIAPEVYVRPFPGPGGKWRISTEGGVFPHWSQTAHELLFTNQGKVWFAPYTATGDAFRAGKPQLWAPTEFRDNGLNYPYDIHPDGKRLALTAVQERVGVQDNVVFISNFFDYVKKVVPGK